MNATAEGRKRLTFFVYASHNPNPTTALPAASAQLKNNMELKNRLEEMKSMIARAEQLPLKRAELLMRGFSEAEIEEMGKIMDCIDVEANAWLMHVKDLIHRMESL